MKAGAGFTFLAILALAGCELQVSGPPPHGPGRPVPMPELIERAERACVAQAGEQRLRVRQVVSTDVVTGSRGRVIGTQSVLRVSRRGQTYPVRCNYTFDTRTARITSIQRG